MNHMFPVRKTKLEIFGPFAIHDMPCAVEPKEHAVYHLDNGVFYPSWEAQRAGWKLVHAKTRFQRWILNLIFDGEK